MISGNYRTRSSTVRYRYPKMVEIIHTGNRDGATGEGVEVSGTARFAFRYLKL